MVLAQERGRETVMSRRGASNFSRWMNKHKDHSHRVRNGVDGVIFLSRRCAPLHSFLSRYLLFTFSPFEGGGKCPLLFVATPLNEFRRALVSIKDHRFHTRNSYPLLESWNVVTEVSFVMGHFWNPSLAPALKIIEFRSLVLPQYMCYVNTSYIILSFVWKPNLNKIARKFDALIYLSKRRFESTYHK